MKTRYTRWILAVLILALGLSVVGVIWRTPNLSHGTASATGSVTSSADRGKLGIIAKVFEVHGRMDLIVRLGYEHLPLDYGDFNLPDEWKPGNPQYELWLRTTGKPESVPRWKDGNALRGYFLDPNDWKGMYTLFDLTDQEFNEFMTDSFDPNNGRFRYILSGSYSGDIGMLLASKGPDSDQDIDISKFNLGLDDYGLGVDFVDRTYDPTNGIVSNGDILVSGGGGPCKETRGSIYPWKSCPD